MNSCWDEVVKLKGHRFGHRSHERARRDYHCVLHCVADDSGEGSPRAESDIDDLDMGGMVWRCGLYKLYTFSAATTCPTQGMINVNIKGLLIGK